MRTARTSLSIVTLSLALVGVAALALAGAGCSDDDVKPDTTPQGDMSTDMPAADLAADQAPISDVQQGDGAQPDMITADAGAPGCSTGFAGCTTFEDKTGSASVTVSFGGAAGNTYSPKCIKVKVGTSVTFQGSFTFHPLQQACGPASVITNGSGSSASCDIGPVRSLIPLLVCLASALAGACAAEEPASPRFCRQLIAAPGAPPADEPALLALLGAVRASTRALSPTRRAAPATSTPSTPGLARSATPRRATRS